LEKGKDGQQNEGNQRKRKEVGAGNGTDREIWQIISTLFVRNRGGVSERQGEDRGGMRGEIKSSDRKSTFETQRLGR